MPDTNHQPVKPVLPWIGGKRKLAKHLLPLFPEHTCYVEPFCGAATIYLMKPPSKTEIINDVHGDLVNLYRVVKYHLEELYKEFKWMLISREHFNGLRDHGPGMMTDIQRAARFLYLQKMAFGGKVSSHTFGTATTSPPRFNLLRIEQDLSDAHLRLARTFIENLPWHDCCTRYDRPHTLFYLDPPYWQTEGYGVDFPWAEYERIRDFMATCKGKVILSIGDHPDIRSLYAEFRKAEVSHTYTVGGADKVKAVNELIYCNW